MARSPASPSPASPATPASPASPAVPAVASPFARLWGLDPAVTFLNHGSFGACPLHVLECQRRWRDRLESEPVRFMVRELEPALDRARAVLAAFVGADPDDLVFVPNATTGVSTVLRSLTFAAGDELLVTDQAYNACRNALDAAAAASGARVVIVVVPFPLPDADVVVRAMLAAVSSRTRLALIDHVTSPTGVVLPVERLVPALAARGVDCLIDGAHVPGMLPLDLRSLGAAYYTANCHKWLCAPKGAALLHVRRDRQDRVRPLVTSHGRNSPRTDRSRFQIEFGWTGTDDPTAWLAVPDALEHLGAAVPGGWPEIMRRNHALVLQARDVLCRALGITPPAPDSLLGSLASVPLPDAAGPPPSAAPWLDSLQEQLWQRHAIEVPLHAWPAHPRRLLRVSAQLYNTSAQYERLAAALGELL